MDIERKTINFEVKAIDEETGIFEGYAATFSKKPDSYGDIIDPGAFKKTLAESGKRVKILWQHSIMEPIGKPAEMTEDEKGLHIKAKLSLGVQRAREVMSLMKDGVITEMSIGYDTIKQSYEEGTRHLKEVKLYDISPVVFAANPEALIVGVKQSELKPYPSEHACRLRDPDDFQEGSFKRTTRVSDSKKYSIIMGRLNGETTLTEQAYRYDKEIWSEGEATSHCKEHDGHFEPAEKQEKSGRVLSATSLDKVRAALHALEALLEAAEREPEPGKSTLLSEADKEAVELEYVITGLKAENEGFNTKEAEARIEEAILAQLK